MPKTPIKKEGNHYDKLFKEILEELIPPLLKQYWDVEITIVKKLRNKLQTTTEREADFLSEVTDQQGRRFILHIEYQSKDDKDMIYRFQEYHGIISRKYQLPIRHFVFYFGNRPSKMARKLPENEIFQGFTVLDFKTIDYQNLLNSKIGSEIVLAILSDFKDRNAEAVIRVITQQLRRVSKSEAELKKYFRQLNVLSKLRNLKEETNKIISEMPIAIDFDESEDFLYIRGQKEKTREATINMLKMGADVAFICKALEVSEEYVLKVKKELDQ